MAFVTGQPVVLRDGRPGDLRDDPPGSRPGRSRRSRRTARPRRSSARWGPRTSRRSSSGSATAPADRSAVSPDQRRPEELAPVGDRRVRRRRGLGQRDAGPSWLGHRDVPNEILLRNPALMGPRGPGRRCPARRPCRGLRGHLRRPLPGHLHRRRRRPPERDPPYADFAAGHDEMLVNDAIALSAREGRWVDVDRTTSPASPAGSSSPAGGRGEPVAVSRRALDEARPADRPVPRDTARRRRRLDRRQRLRIDRDRLLAAGGRRRAAGRRHLPHRRRQSEEGPGRRHRRRRCGSRARHLRSRLLPEPAPSGRGPSRRWSSAT